MSDMWMRCERDVSHEWDVSDLRIRCEFIDVSECIDVSELWMRCEWAYRCERVLLSIDVITLHL